MELEKLKESLTGYTKQRDIIARKRDAISRAREVVKKGMKKINPVYEYENDSDYWQIEKDLYDCKVDQDLLNYGKEITTIEDAMKNIEERIERMEGEKNE